MNQRDIPRPNPALIVIILIAGAALLLVFTAFGTVDAGMRGVHTRFSKVTGKIHPPGLYFIMPLIDKVEIMDVQVQVYEAQATASSSDLQIVQSAVALNYHVLPEDTAELYKNVGREYNKRIIEPALQESVKAATANYTAEQLITKRAEVRDEIKALLDEKLDRHGIFVDAFNIVDFDFSENFNASIEAKVKAEQEALTAKNKLEEVKFQAEQAIAEARGKAEAISIEAEALEKNPQVLQLRAVEKWDGIMPQVTGGEIPFISIDTP
ncbi:MAG: prohibitin family protein [Candidatus Poribacteria bacterium]|nr:prohibitin family protein [Candidatus Poribacteria bacterium]